MNRQQRRTLARDKKFQADVARVVLLEFKDAVDPDVLYRDGILESIRRNTGEIHIVVTREGHDDPYFTAIPLNSIYDGLRESSRVWAEGWNAALDQRIAEVEMTPKEIAARKEEKLAEAKAAQEEQRAAALERLRDLRKQVTDPECLQRWIDDIDADIAKLENPSSNASDERTKDDRPVS